jgi:hypothetical protein
MEKRVSPLPNVRTSRREQKLVYFRFQIDVLNIEFYFSFLEIAHYCTGFPSPDGNSILYKVIFHPYKRYSEQGNSS